MYLLPVFTSCKWGFVTENPISSYDLSGMLGNFYLSDVISILRKKEEILSAIFLPLILPRIDDKEVIDFINPYDSNRVSNSSIYFRKLFFKIKKCDLFRGDDLHGISTDFYMKYSLVLPKIIATSYKDSHIYGETFILNSNIEHLNIPLNKKIYSVVLE